MRERRLVGLIAALAAGCTLGSGPVAAAEVGLIKLGDRTYRDVIATCLQRPFLTDADMRSYVTDTRGRVATDGGPVLFSYPGIEQVLVEGRRLPVLRQAADLIQVRMAVGVHDVEIVASGAAGALDLPQSFERGAELVSA